MDGPATRDDVLHAAETIRGRVRRTPLLDGEALAPGLRLKAELLQHTGSFKARGVVNRLSALDADERARGVAGASAGNHAIALAWGAAAEGIDCAVFSWPGGSTFKLDRARALGAEIDLSAADPADAFAKLEAHLDETGRVLVHPFDDPRVMAGQGTVGLEVLEDAPDVDVVVVPVGGGGLVSGIAAAVAPRGVRVVAVEPENALTEILVSLEQREGLVAEHFLARTQLGEPNDAVRTEHGEAREDEDDARKSGDERDASVARHTVLQSWIRRRLVAPSRRSAVVCAITKSPGEGQRELA